MTAGVNSRKGLASPSAGLSASRNSSATPTEPSATPAPVSIDIHRVRPFGTPVAGGGVTPVRTAASWLHVL